MIATACRRYSAQPLVPRSRLPTQTLSSTPLASGRHPQPPAAAPTGRPAEPLYYPGIEEESEVLHEAFHRAFEEAKPTGARIPGLQEFAAALYERRRHIPSNHDPLMHVFQEFDTDNDGFLAAPEIATALRSRGVEIDAEQVQWLINVYEKERTCMLPSFNVQSISQAEWPNFVYSLCVADLHAQADPAHGSLDSP